MNSLQKYLAIGTLATASLGGLEAQMTLQNINNPMNPSNPAYWSIIGNSDSKFEKTSKGEIEHVKKVGTYILYVIGATVALTIIGENILKKK